MPSILLFHDFPWPSLKFHDFPGLEIEITNSMTFQVFHDLYEPCLPIEHVRMKSYLPRKNIYFYVLDERMALFRALITPKRTKLTYHQGYKKSYNLLLNKSRNIPFSKLYHKITFNWEAYKRIQLIYNHWRVS